MIRRPLGKTGISVSEIAFGGVEIGMPYGIGVRSASDMLSEQQSIQLLHAAIDSGINFFDTARMYGNSETIMGNAFNDRRAQVVLSTKCRHLRDNQGNLPADYKLKEIIEKSLYESLDALQTNYVDVFMLHQADIGILENDQILSVFLELKKKGFCRAVGVSTYTPEETKKAIDVNVWDMIQVPFNLMDQRQEASFAAASEKGIGIIVRSVLLKGLLSDRGKGLHPALKKVEDHIHCYHELLEGSGCDLPSVATKFALSFPEVSSILVGIDRMEYLNKSLAVADGNYLDRTMLSRARALAYPDPEFLNLPYWDKMNWLR